MKQEITLKKPILVNGKEQKVLTYDTEEISVALFSEADGRKLKATGGAAKQAISGVGELDYSFHLYLGIAAVIAVNPEIDWSDLERIKGFDAVQIMRVGRNFFSESEEGSEESVSDPLSEITPEPFTPLYPTSSEEA
jgi:hypothetical protein